METFQSINREADEKQQLSIPRKELNLKICENRNQMFNELIFDIRKDLVVHARTNYPKLNKADHEDLASSTIFKILNNEATKEKFGKSNSPLAYAQKILENLFIDEYRKKKDHFLDLKRIYSKCKNRTQLLIAISAFNCSYLVCTGNRYVSK